MKTMAHTAEHVLSFTADGKLFAFINEQGILRIWDTETNELKQEYTPNLHLSGPCTALTWITVTVAANKPIDDKKTKKQCKSSISTKEVLYLALGTSKGTISLYSYAEGKVERNFKGEGHNARITSIVSDNDGHLYTCGEDCQVIKWSIPNEKRITGWSIGSDKPYSIAYMAKSKNIVVGCRQIKVFSTETQELVQTFTGHTSEVNVMQSIVVNNNVEYVLTTSRMERIICLWKIGKKGLSKPASCTLLMEDIAHCLTCQMNDGDGTLNVASVTRSGVMHIYLIALETIKVDKPVKPKVTVEIASDGTDIIEPIPVVAATLQHSFNTDEILLGYGNKLCMMFEQLKPNFSERMQILVRSDPKKLYAQKSGKKKALSNDSVLKTLTPIINQDEVEYKSAINLPKKKVQNELPMEARLQNLNLNPTDGSVKPQAHSKVQLLVQALHSKDANLLRTVLCTKDPITIQLTTQRLPVQYVGTLVNELTHLMQQHRQNVEYAILWLKALTQTHSSQLMALGSDDLLNKFGPCIGIIEHRASCLKELSRFNGRLQLLVQQIKTNNSTDDFINSDSVLVYDDQDSGSELDEELKAESLDEWEEDDINENDIEDEDDDDMDDDDDALDSEAEKQQKSKRNKKKMKSDGDGDEDDDDDFDYEVME